MSLHNVFLIRQRAHGIPRSIKHLFQQISCGEDSPCWNQLTEPNFGKSRHPRVSGMWASHGHGTSETIRTPKNRAILFSSSPAFSDRPERRRPNKRGGRRGARRLGFRRRLLLRRSRSGNNCAMPQSVLVERATSESLIGPEWSLNLEICDILNHDPS